MSIASFLGKLFNVRSGEWRRLSILYCMTLAILTGLTWADAVVQGAFLQRVGVQYLPWVIISCAACSIVALFIYSAFADRVSNTRLLIAILAISAAGILLALATLAAGLVGPAYLLLFVVLQVPLLDVFNVHYATYVNGFYDIRTAKRIIPVLGTSGRVAGIVGGLSMPLMNRLLSPAAILGVGVASLAIMALLAAAMPRLMHERHATAGALGSTPGAVQPVPALAPSGPARGRVQRFGLSYGAALREGYRQIERSPFLRWMALSTFAMTILLVLLNYESSAIFQAELKTTVAIADFLGLLGGAANLAVLLLQLFVLSRLISRLGLGNASLIYPLASLGISASLAVVPGLGTAALAYLDRTALRTAFRNSTDMLLYNAVPLRVKARTRAFVGGLVIPFGAILGALLLLTPLMRTWWFLRAGLLVLGLLFAVAGLMVRRNYGPALLDLLEQEDYSSLALQAPSPQGPTALVADTATLARLAAKLRQTTASPERAIFMARLIVEIGGEAAVPIIAEAALDATGCRLRASLVDVLAAAGVRGPDVRALYVEMLADADGAVRLAALGGLEQIDGPRDRRYLELATRALADPEIAVRLRVLPALLSAGDPGRQAAGGAELRTMLNTPEPLTRAQALRVVGDAHVLALLPEVVCGLADEADEPRLAAALAAETLAQGALDAASRELLCQSVMVLLQDPIERARVAAVTVLGRLGQEGGPDAYAAREGLAVSLADASPEVREQAIAGLVRCGQRAVPHVFEQLTGANPRARKMAAVVLARIEPRKYAPLVQGPNLTGNLRAVYRNQGCWQALASCPGPAVAVLGSALRERNAGLLDEMFYLLASIHDPAAVKSIACSLRSSQPQARANAVEALESLTSPQTVALVAPLFEPDLPPGALLSLAERAWGMPVPTAAGALRLLLSDAGDACVRTLATAVLAEVHAAGGPLSPAEMALLLGLARADLDAGVRAEVSVAGLDMTSKSARTTAGALCAPAPPALSLVDRLILLKEVPFFSSMKVDQLMVLASLCEVEHFPEGGLIFAQGDGGGTFYVLADGEVAIEQETRPGSCARLAVIEPHSYFGEGNLFDNSRRTTSAVVLRDALTLRLRCEPLIELAGQQPDISLELINALAGRLREANDQVARLAHSRPQKLHRLFDSMQGGDLLPL